MITCQFFFKRMEKNFLLQSNLSVSNNEVRCLVGNIKIKDLDAFACGDRNNFLHTFVFDSNKQTYSRINSFKAHNATISCL